MYSSIYVGRVLNRFSKDIGFVDAALPYEFVDFLTVSIEIIGMCIYNTCIIMCALRMVSCYTSNLHMLRFGGSTNC